MVTPLWRRRSVPTRAVDVVLVPLAKVAPTWYYTAGFFFWNIPGFDYEKLEKQLLVGVSRLWIALDPDGPDDWRSLQGAIATTVRDTPPTQQKAFQRSEPTERKSLVVHVGNGKYFYRWIDTAIRLITHYGLEQGCRQLFVMAREPAYARKFYAPAWSAVGYTRDRANVANARRRHTRVGFYRLVKTVPAAQWKPRTHRSQIWIKEDEHAIHCSSATA